MEETKGKGFGRGIAILRVALGAGFLFAGLDKFVEAGSRTYGAGPALRLPIFEGGRLRANLGARSAEVDAAVEGYNGALLRALREVADELSSLQSLERQQRSQAEATAAANAAYDLALQELQAPPKNSPSSRATVQVLSGFGNEAFSALQVFHVGGAVTDVATVTVRYRNVVVTVTLNGLAHAQGGDYGPVSQSQLTTAAMAFAKAAEAALQ